MIKEKLLESQITEDFDRIRDIFECQGFNRDLLLNVIQQDVKKGLAAKRLDACYRLDSSYSLELESIIKDLKEKIKSLIEENKEFKSKL